MSSSMKHWIDRRDFITGASALSGATLLGGKRRFAIKCHLLFAVAVSVVSFGTSAHEDEQMPTGAPDKVGEVSFPISCSAAAQKEFNRGVAILHSFFYPEAGKTFTKVTEIDPSCAMGYWGIAMSWWYPLWYPPTKALRRNSNMLPWI